MSPDLPIFPGLLATPWRFLWHVPTQTAILSDLHLGAVAGTHAPYLHAAWSELASRGPKQVILGGDVLDNPNVPPSAIALLSQFLATLPRNCKVILTPGNHDPHDLGSTLQIDSQPHITLDHYIISHGHEFPADLSSKHTWIVGHQHPAVTLRTRVQSGKLPCYALCKPTKPRPGLLLLPAFNRDAGGPLGSNLLAPSTWLLPIPRPTPRALHIYGLIESAKTPPQLLPYGKLADLTP